MFPIPSARRRVEDLVHPDARVSQLERARHELFIFARLATLVLVAAFVPRYLAMAGAGAIWQVGAFVWLIAPLAAIVHLARTGNLIEAQLISLFGLALLALIVTVGAGLSPELALGWLMLLPLEAAISGSSSMLRFASLLAIASLLALVGRAKRGMDRRRDADRRSRRGRPRRARRRLRGAARARRAQDAPGAAQRRNRQFEALSGSLGRDRRPRDAPRRRRRRDIGERRRERPCSASRPTACSAAGSSIESTSPTAPPTSMRSTRRRSATER